MHLTFKRFSKLVSIPTAQHPGDAGYDLEAAVDLVLAPGSGRWSQPASPSPSPQAMSAWSFLALGAITQGLSVVNAPGIVDAGYRGELKAVLINHGSEPIEIKVGDRIAQLVIVAVREVVWREVNELEESDRGEAGFGSTG